MTYNPINSSNLNDYIKDGDKFLRYYLSICYKDNVMKNGLVSNKCFGFDINYSSERLYFIIDYPSKTTLKMLKAFAYKQLQTGYSKEFVCCVVYASELIDKGFVFYKNPNFKDCCYYTRKVTLYKIIDYKDLSYYGICLY